ncbi:mitochondrial substrate carrier family protein [Citrus sinensis]|uniref:Mitochondrial substrate carrier family protein n=1 Tax=Citrus sinensis TaxID=2711 RepID=A0ACB8I357_CITSI|nr:mitochondrial substrate carrier family protein [Citrus sinensis]
MQTEARLGVVVEGGQRGLSSSNGSVSIDKISQKQQQKRSGGVAGALSKTCTAPLARLTILFKVKANIWHEASRIISEEGFRPFWKGNLLLHAIPVVESQGENMSSNRFVHFASCGLAGITAASVTYPLDLVRTRLVAQTKVIYYRGNCHALQTICRDEGILGLYKGLGATLLGVGPSIAISFSVYETLRSFWHLSTIASSITTFPLDLVRQRKELEEAGGWARGYTTGLFCTFKYIIRTEGFRGLYRGILLEYYKAVPGVGICFMIYETLKILLADISS